MTTATEKAVTPTNGHKPLAGALDFSKIQELMGKGRVRGVYEAKLAIFVDSDEPAINVAETWSMEFSKKPATTLYQGFNNLLNKLDLKATIEVKQSDGQVYLLHNERIAVLRAAAEAK